MAPGTKDILTKPIAVGVIRDEQFCIPIICFTNNCSFCQFERPFTEWFLYIDVRPSLIPNFLVMLGVE